MPVMDGITFLDKIMTLRPMPVVMVSSLTESGRATTLPLRTACSSSSPPKRGCGQSRSVPVPPRTTKISSSSEWQCSGADSFPGATTTCCRPPPPATPPPESAPPPHKTVVTALPIEPLIPRILQKLEQHGTLVLQARKRIKVNGIPRRALDLVQMRHLADRGQPLLQVYSPDLVLAQQEYALLSKSVREDGSVDGEGAGHRPVLRDDHASLGDAVVAAMTATWLIAVAMAVVAVSPLAALVRAPAEGTWTASAGRRSMTTTAPNCA